MPVAHSGDRPIEITLQRAWQALTWPQRLKLLGLLIQSGPVDPSELNAQAVEALKDDDIITSVVAEYSEKFPQVNHVDSDDSYNDKIPHGYCLLSRLDWSAHRQRQVS